MSHGVQGTTWEGWWRWPLVPIASVAGALLGTAAFTLFQMFSAKLYGTADGWHYQYLVPIGKDAIFGFLTVYCGCYVAPRGKQIVGVVLTTLLGVLFIFSTYMGLRGYVGESPNLFHAILSALACVIGGVIAVVNQDN